MCNQNIISDNSNNNEYNNRNQATTSNPNPSQRQKKAEQSAPSKTVPCRRIGTMTLGFTLILLGIVLIVYLFHPFDLSFLMKFSPVLLIVLGAEILWQYFYRNGQTLRYDFWGTLFCIFLIFFSVGLSCLYPFIHFAPLSWETQQKLEQQIYDEIYPVIPQSSPVTFLEVEVDLNSISSYTQQDEPKKLNPADHVSLFFRLSSQQDIPSFAKNVRGVLDYLSPLEYDNLSVSVSAPHPGGEYEISLNDRFRQRLSAQQMEELVADIPNVEADVSEEVSYEKEYA